MAHQLRVLGPPEVLDGDGNPVSLSLGKPLALLIYVACKSSPVSRDDLADLLWPEVDGPKGRHSVRQALWVLRHAFGEDLFENHDPLSLREGELDVDLHEFLGHLSDGRVDNARALWRGPALEHLLLAGLRTWNHWAEELRGGLERRFSRALLAHGKSLSEMGASDEALAIFDQAIEIAPSSEGPHLARIGLLLSLHRVDLAREALSDAHRNLGDQAESMGRLAALEEELDRVAADQRARLDETEAFPMEFVGRTRDLAGLQSLWREAEAGRTRAAVITGPSGIGKTRIAQEFLSHISMDGVRTISVRGTRAGMKLRWGVASDLIRQMLRLPGSPGISPASDSLFKALLPSTGREAISVETLNGVSPASILDAVNDLTESVTFEAPLVIICDDTQWLDPDSLTLFQGLGSRIRELRILFLILGRSDLSSRRWDEIETLLQEEVGAQRFLLNPLIEEEVGELLALGASFPDPETAATMVAKIHRASRGNPLFIREILRELQENRILQQEGHGWVFRTANLPGEIRIPESISSLLQDRMARLTEPAAKVAATLAGRRTRSSPATLRKETELPGAVFTGAVAELLERGVVEWADGTSLDFVHDLLRDTAKTHLAGSLPETQSKAQWLARNQGVVAMIVGILIALPLGILWGRGELPWEAEAPPPYGGGTIFLMKGVQTPRAVRIVGEPLDYTRPDRDPLTPREARYVFRAQDGGFLGFGIENREDGPDLVQIFQNGRTEPLIQEPGDQSLYDLSPEGTRILFTSENVGKEPFSHSLYWAPLSEPRDRHLILEGSGPLGLARWSPDGDLVAFIQGAASDSLAVYSLSGERIWSHPFGEIYSLDWCGQSVVLAASPEREMFLFRADPVGDVVTPLTPLNLGAGVTCSPDGTAVLHFEVVNRRPRFVLRNLTNGMVYPFPDFDLKDHRPVWIPDSVIPVPTEVRTREPDTIRIEWGSSRGLAASAVLPGSFQTSDDITWESLDPSVASFNPKHELTGNQSGITKVVARWKHSLSDTVVVLVEDNGMGSNTALLRERWDSIRSDRWIQFGSHPPKVSSIDGGQALQLLGDEKYSDGLMYRDSLPLDQGVTAEFEFKMDLTDDVHQNIRLCLHDTDPLAFDPDSGVYPPGGEMLCSSYPSREFQKLDPSEVSLQVTPGAETRVRIPEALPTSGWTHVAVQVRADGECSLVINRERVATLPILLPNDPIFRWTLLVEGDAVGTDLFVRNLNIWREVRY